MSLVDPHERFAAAAHQQLNQIEGDCIRLIRRMRRDRYAHKLLSTAYRLLLPLAPSDRTQGYKGNRYSKKAE